MATPITNPTFTITTSIPKSLTKPSLSPTSFPLKTPNPKPRFITATTAAATPTTPITASRETLKSRLRRGPGSDPLYGIFLLSFSPTMAEIAGFAGYDYAVVDMEHGPGGITDALHCLRALAAADTPAILRLPETSATWAKKALDLGPQGIMFPMIDSPADAARAVSFCRFPPRGVRGAAHPVVRASRYGVDEGYLSNCEDELLIMCQVESTEGAGRAAEIAAVEGVDCVQMGPLDLSASMGYLWDPAHGEVGEALRRTEKAVLGGGVGAAFLSGFAMPHDGPEAMAARGYHMVAGAVDVGLFRSAAVADVRRFRMSLVKESGGGGDDEKYWSE